MRTTNYDEENNNDNNSNKYIDRRSTDFRATWGVPEFRVVAAVRSVEATDSSTKKMSRTPHMPSFTLSTCWCSVSHVQYEPTTDRSTCTHTIAYQNIVNVHIKFQYNSGPYISVQSGLQKR